MFPQTFDLNLIIQGLLAAVIIGMVYSVWATTRAYGGLIGKAVRLLGFGIVFIIIEVIEKMLINFGAIKMTSNLAMTEDILIIIGLFFLTIGFSRLAVAAKN